MMNGRSVPEDRFIRLPVSIATNILELRDDTPG